MARQSRQVNNRQDTYYHIPLRTVGMKEDRPFGPAERRRLRELLIQVSLFYTVRVVDVTFLGNHVHLVVKAPARLPRRALVRRRWLAYYAACGTPKAEPNWEDLEAVGRIAAKMRSISEFVKMFKQRAAVWFNHHAQPGRRGSLWCNRFVSKIVTSSGQLLFLMRYVDLNPVKAGMASGALAGMLNVPGAIALGSCPFAADYLKTLRSCWDRPCAHLDDDELFARHVRHLERIRAGSRGALPEEMDRYLI